MVLAILFITVQAWAATNHSQDLVAGGIGKVVGWLSGCSLRTSGLYLRLAVCLELATMLCGISLRQFHQSLPHGPLALFQSTIAALCAIVTFQLPLGAIPMRGSAKAFALAAALAAIVVLPAFLATRLVPTAEQQRWMRLGLYAVVSLVILLNGIL